MASSWAPLPGQADLSQAAERLLAYHIDSVCALDLLLLLDETGDRDWSSSELCTALRCPEGWAGGELRRLRRLGMAVELAGGRHRYQQERQYGDAVNGIAGACCRDRGAIVRRIFRPASTPGRGRLPNASCRRKVADGATGSSARLHTRKNAA